MHCSQNEDGNEDSSVPHVRACTDVLQHKLEHYVVWFTMMTVRGLEKD